MSYCGTCGCRVVYNSNAAEWGWPYACTWCDREQLPENLRADNPWNPSPKRPQRTKMGRWLERVFG